MWAIFNYRFYPCFCRHLSEDMQMKPKWKYLLLLFSVVVPAILAFVIATVDHTWIRIITGSLLTIFLIVYFFLMYEPYKKAAAEIKGIPPATELEVRATRRRTNQEPEGGDDRPDRSTWTCEVRQPDTQSSESGVELESDAHPRLSAKYLRQCDKYSRRRDEYYDSLILMHAELLAWLLELNEKGELDHSVLYPEYLHLLPQVMLQDSDRKIPARFEGEILTPQEFDALLREYLRAKPTNEWFRQYWERRANDSIIYQPDIHTHDPDKMDPENTSVSQQVIDVVETEQDKNQTDSLPQVTQRSRHPSAAEQESSATVTKAEVYRPFSDEAD